MGAVGILRATIMLLTAGGLLLGCQAGGRGSAMDADEMQAAMSAALEVPNLGERYVAIASLLGKMTPENAPGAGEAYREDLFIVRSCEMRPFASVWGGLDPDTAIEWAVNLQALGNQRRREAISEVLGSWVLMDQGKAASEFLATIEYHHPDRRLVANNLITGLATSPYPNQAIPVLASLPDDDNRDMLLFRILLERMRRNLHGIRDFVDAVPEDAANNLKAKAFERGLAMIVGLNPQYAMEWYSHQKVKAYTGGGAIASMVSGLATNDPEYALPWLAGLPPSQERDDGLRDAVYSWLQSRPEDASAYLRGELYKEEMAVAIFPYAQWMMGQDAKEAVEWARRVPHPTERTRALTQALVLWGRSDRNGVILFLREAPEVNEHVLDTVTDLLNIKPQELS